MSERLPTRTASFMRLRQEGRSEEVVRRLGEVIELGLFEQGEQLPSEAELAQQFGVATVTLREALSHLRQRGLIETRRGRNGGSFVRGVVETPEHILYERLMAWTPAELRDLGDEHRAISGAAARLAAQRSCPDHHARLEHYVQAMAQADSRLARRRADARFHIEVAVAAQSVRLTRAELQLQAEVGELLWLNAPGQPSLAEVVAQHRAISQAIAAGDAALAGQLAEQHIARAITGLVDVHLQNLAQQAN